jgi:hypothetical protein
MISPNMKRIADLGHDGQDKLMEYLIAEYPTMSPAQQEATAGILALIADQALTEVDTLNQADATLLRLLERQVTAGTDFCDLDPATMLYLLENDPDEAWGMLGESTESLLAGEGL